MAAIIIPTQFGIPSFTVRVDLTGVEFVLALHFNDREDFWYLSVFDAEGIAIVESVKVVLNVPLLRNVMDERRPVGDFIAIDTTQRDLEATEVEELGDRVLLVYEDGL